MSNFTPTERTKVRRKPDRGSYDRELIYRILDEAFVCQVAFIDNGMPIVVPTNYVRVGDKLFLHGSTASRLMKTLSSGAPFCLNVMLLDGIVCSPSATGHSVNYRSVVVMGKAEIVEGEAAKLGEGTMVLAVPLVEASAKVRTGFAVNEDEDYATPTWTGVIPMKWISQAPVADPRGNPAIPAPANILSYSRPQ